MRSLEELNREINLNSTCQEDELGDYKKLIMELIDSNVVDTEDNYGKPYSKTMWFRFNRNMDSVIFNYYTNSSQDIKYHREDMETVIKYLYGKNHGDLIEDFITYLVSYAFPHFKGDRRIPDWYCGNVTRR